jgi:hypothetical protein
VSKPNEDQMDPLSSKPKPGQRGYTRKAKVRKDPVTIADTHQGDIVALEDGRVVRIMWKWPHEDGSVNARLWDTILEHGTSEPFHVAGNIRVTKVRLST